MPTIESTIEGAIQRRRVHITATDIVAIGAATSGEVALGVTLPVGAKILRSRIQNAGDAAATLSTLTASLGETGGLTDILAAGTVFAANAVVETAPVDPFVAQTAAYALAVGFVGDVNLDTLTDLDGGVDVLIEWTEK